MLADAFTYPSGPDGIPGHPDGMGADPYRSTGSLGLTLTVLAPG